MKIERDHLAALEKVANAHFALQQRLNEILFLEGAKLFEPLKDMSLDPGDIQAIESQLFKILEQYPEFKQYLDVRKETISFMMALLTSMRKADDSDWRNLVETELGLQIAKGVQVIAGKMGLAYGSKSYIQ